VAVATTVYTPQTTSIPGLIVFDIENPTDDRGYFQEKFQRAKLVAAGMPESFTVVQNSLSYNKDAGVARGIHAEPWEKYISLVTGRVFVAYVDLRDGPTFGVVETLELTPNKAVFLPRGVGNSFQTLEPDTYYLYSVNEHWSADNLDQYTFVNLADPDLAITWPIPLEQSIISEKDKNHPLLKTITPMKVQS
jgi:dTDP-4-dehydrorhamnose 3,5-epimerase